MMHGSRKQESIRTVPNVLIVDDDRSSTGAILKILAKKGAAGRVAVDASKARRYMENSVFDMAFINIELAGDTEGQSAFELLKEIKAFNAETPVVLLAGPVEDPEQSKRIVEKAVESVRLCCAEFMVKPVVEESIFEIIDRFVPMRAAESYTWQYDVEKPAHKQLSIVGRSGKLLHTVTMAKKIARTSVPVLISGESGTGKELFSSLIHHCSNRSNGPFVRVNCAALSENLLESELFGHEKGAFTGAHVQRKGRFELAHGGTLLLDEITETPLSFQAKLLRVLEQQDFERVGGNESVNVNVRIVSTTNKNLAEQVRAGRFRADLYYRLSAARLVVAPLRERFEDLEDLIWHFINLHAHESDRRINRIDATMINLFAKYSWPGNVRQLRNVVVNSLILGTGDTLYLADASWLADELELCDDTEPGEVDVEFSNNIGGISLEKLERRAILETLEQTDGNQAKAARVLGISDRTLRGKIKRYKEEGCYSLT